MKIRLAFIILNYNTFEDTVQCVDSIYKYCGLKKGKFRIIIVDNCSPDGSAEKLEDKYSADSDITLLKNDSNMGFARGNNVGIDYALEKYNFEYIVVLNSDTELIQDGFFERIDEEYNKSHFALLGPLVINGAGHCDCSPFLEETLEQALNTKKALLKRRQRIKNNLDYIHNGFVFLYNGIMKKETANPFNIIGDFHKRQLNVVPCGCFLVFSRDTFTFIPGFDERTFLFFEEQILFQQLKRNGLTTVYTPDICIYHKQGASSVKSHRTRKEKLLFENTCSINSLNVLIDILKGTKKSGF